MWGIMMKISIALLLLLGLLFNIQTHSAPYDVIIVGAGIAGLTAAKQLHENGLNILILEGDDRIGGRIHTIDVDGTPVDLGASWIHGINGNPIYKLVKELKIKTLPTNYNNALLFGPDRQPIPDQDLQRAPEIIEGFYQFCANRAALFSTDCSLKDALNAYKNTLSSSTEKLIADGMFAAYFEQEYGAKGSQLSLFHSFKYPKKEGDCDGNDVLIVGGYDKVITHLAQPFAQDENKLKKKHNVIAISYNETTSLVTVATDNGVTFETYCVLCTVPLGVLKKNKITFTPKLPEFKQQAINNLGMGVYDKVVLQFDKPFWTESNPSVDFIAQITAITPFNGYLNYHHYNEKNILINASIDNRAMRQEGMELNEVSAEHVVLLKSLFPGKTPVLKKAHVTRWGNNKFSYGSYSHCPPGIKRETYDDMAASIANYLFFAGEATHKDHHSTVHGAYLSGLREAENITLVLRHKEVMRAWLKAGQEGSSRSLLTKQLTTLKQNLKEVQQNIDQLSQKITRLRKK